MKKVGFLILIVCSLLFGQAAYANPPKENIFSTLDLAFNAQLSLTEGYRTMEEINKILTPYFTEEYIDLFLEEHLYQDENGYTILGSDTFEYIVPFFSYNESTKVIKVGNQIQVIELFKGSNEGGVVWEDHYEGLLLTQTSNKEWKISQYYSGFKKPRILE